MHPRLTANWASRIGTYRARVNKQTGIAVRERLERVRDRWGNDVRVDTSHYKDTVLSTEPEMTSETSGRIQPKIEGKKDDYFYYNEYGAPTISARPSMRQAIAAEKADFDNVIGSIFKDIGL